jgi:hypothetical protein
MGPETSWALVQMQTVTQQAAWVRHLAFLLLCEAGVPGPWMAFGTQA